MQNVLLAVDALSLPRLLWLPVSSILGALGIILILLFMLTRKRRLLRLGVLSILGSALCILTCIPIGGYVEPPDGDESEVTDAIAWPIDNQRVFILARNLGTETVSVNGVSTGCLVLRDSRGIRYYIPPEESARVAASFSAGQMLAIPLNAMSPMADGFLCRQLPRKCTVELGKNGHMEVKLLQ